MQHKKELRFGSVVTRYISRFPGLEYTGTNIRCIFCDANIACWNSNQCKLHVQSKRHIANQMNNVPYWKFMYDFVYMMSACNIPHNLVDNEHFRLFWKKYVSWKLLKRRQFQYQLPRVKSMVETNIKCELKDKKVWLTINKFRDGKNVIGSVIVRILQPEGPSVPYLLCSKRLKRFNAKVVALLIHETIRKFDIRQNNFLMLVTDGSTLMLNVGTFLKEHFPNLLHITCLIHTLHRVAKTVQDSYPLVSTLITQTKVAFMGRERTKEFRKFCPGIPLPPQPSVKKSASWLEAAAYHSKYFNFFKSLMVNSDLKSSKGFQACSQYFMYPQVEEELRTISENYVFIVEAINQLQNTTLSLADSLDIVDNVRTILDSLSDGPAFDIALSFRTALNENPDFDKLWCISKCQSEPDDPEHFFQQYFQYANITSSDAERSFSKYRLSCSSLQKRLTESTMEGFLMMQVYNV